MRIAWRKNIWGVALAALTLAAAPMAQGLGIIFDDPFTDGGFNNGADPNDTSWSWTGGSTNLAVVSDGGSNALRATDPNVRDEYLTPSSFTATSLAVGETLRFTGSWRQGQNPRDGLSRYGVGFMTNTDIWNAYGYSVRFNLGGAAANPDIAFLKENNTQVINPNTPTDAVLTSSSNDLEPSVGTTAFTIQFDLTRTGADAVQLTFVLTQGSNTYTYTANDTSSIYNSFQRMAIRTDQKDGDTGGTFYFDNLKLEVIPEPATVVLMGLGLMLSPLLRRRHD